MLRQERPLPEGIGHQDSTGVQLDPFLNGTHLHTKDTAVYRAIGTLGQGSWPEISTTSTGGNMNGSK